MKRYLKLALWGFVIGFHLVMAFIAAGRVENFITVDSTGYISLAKSLYTKGTFNIPGDYYIELFRPPGYPVFMAVNLILNGGNPSLIPVTQTLILFLTTFMLYRVGKESGSPKAGELAAFLYLINPNAAFWSWMVLSETLSALFLVLTIWQLNRYWQTKRLRWMLIAGLTLGVGSLVRPIAYPLWIVWGVLMFLSFLHASRQQRLMVIKAVLLLALGVFIVVTPWQLRNYLVKDRFTLSITTDYTLEFWNAARVLARAEGMSIDEAQLKITYAANPAKMSWDIFRKYPRLAIIEQFRGILRTGLGAEYGSWASTFTGQPVTTTGIVSIIFDNRGAAALVRAFKSVARNPWFWAGLYALVFDAALLVLNILGLIKLWRNRKTSMSLSMGLVLLTGIGYLILAPLANGDSRFRAPADPLLALLGGFSQLTPSSKTNAS
jgi:4-amino-4-deoxy-L-arabinose transferase-like glycosyltransferase